MSAWFETVFKRTIPIEGGFQNVHGDPGNWTSGVVGKGLRKGTKYGISAATYPDLDIVNLSLDQAKMIYFTDWWEKLDMRDWPEALSYQMFDASINHGMHAANKLLQRAVKVKDDGIVGPITQAAVAAMEINDLCFLFLAERLEYFTNLGNFLTFGKGWCRRIAINLRYAAKDTPNEPVIDKPDSAVVEQKPRFDFPKPREKARGPDATRGTRAKWGTEDTRSDSIGNSSGGRKPGSVDE